MEEFWELKEGYIEIIPKSEADVDAYRTNAGFKCTDNTRICSEFVMIDPQYGFSSYGFWLSQYLPKDSNNYMDGIYDGNPLQYPLELNTKLTSKYKIKLSSGSIFYPVFSTHRCTAKLINFYIEQ